jgi:membrane protein implicated in regulation of membrane protease activity
MPYQRFEIRQVGWRGTLGMILAAALCLGIVAALVVLSLGLAIVLLPVVAVLALIGSFRWRRIIAAAQDEAHRSGKVRIIETDYEVVDDDGDGRRGR